MIGRREIMLGVAATAVLSGGAANACSLTRTRLVRFDDRACRRQIGEWVALLNAGPELSADEIVRRAEMLDVSLEGDMIWDLLGDERPPSSEIPVAYYQRFRFSDGQLDPRPVRISEINLIRRLRNRATYQFTLERYSYHAADPEGCNGLFVHDEYYGLDRTAYLVTFTNNELDSIKLFPEWYLEGSA